MKLSFINNSYIEYGSNGTHPDKSYDEVICDKKHWSVAGWPSGRAPDSKSRGHGFESQKCRVIICMSWSKTH